MVTRARSCDMMYQRDYGFERRSQVKAYTRTYLLHHLALFVEEFHFDVATNWKRLRELKDHVLLFSPRVGRV